MTDMLVDNFAMHYPITLRNIFISPGHNYFGRPKDGPGSHPIEDRQQVDARAGQGLLGDRYFGVAAHYDAQVTMIAWEVFAALQQEVGLSQLSPSLTRRNIVTQGAPLNQLIGHEFAIDCGVGLVWFMGAKACSPCAWMDAMLAPGAREFLRGRGGLRARILSDGILRAGPAMLHTSVELDLALITQPLPRPNLPG